MTRWVKIGFALLFVIAMMPVVPAQAQAQTHPDCLYEGTHSDGAKYCITMPPPPPYGMWNGDLVIFAHGYVPVTAPLDIPWDQMDLGGGLYLPTLVNGMGYAFATTSYSENGLAVKQGLVDILDLIKVFKETVGKPAHIYLVGASEGGLVTTLAIEKYPESFSGGMAMCGPIGSFQGQVNYWGDFRVVFDYFMDRPDYNILPGTAVNIPKALMNKWDSVYISRIRAALSADPARTAQLFSVTGAPIDLLDPITTTGNTTLGILWYNVFATEDAIAKLGGQPYDNRDRVYTGSLNDPALNAGVKRFKAKGDALTEIAANYETSGLLARPLVTLHTRGDPIVPYVHLDLYKTKVGANPLYYDYAVDTIDNPRYGHCAFTLEDKQNGFGWLVAAGSFFPVP